MLYQCTYALSYNPNKSVVGKSCNRTGPDRTEAPEITEVRRRTITDSYEFRYRDLVLISVRTK